MKPFSGSFTQQEALPEDAIAAATAVMRSGRLHRYNVTANGIGLVAALEEAFAAYQETQFCLACASGGYAMGVALRAAGVEPGDKVLTNSFTLAPVPGAIASIGAHPVLVEINNSLKIDFDDLTQKIVRSGARTLLLSHMRGHICDMDVLLEILNAHGVTLIEDCAHTMGAKWKQTRSGNFGLAGCFSTQTYKHINSGEGGLLTSSDPKFMARAIIMSGSYMLYERNGAAPDVHYFEDIRLQTPNISGRMDNLRAAVLLPQLEKLDANIERWNVRYDFIAALLADQDCIVVPKRPTFERYVGSSIQFRLPKISFERVPNFLNQTKKMGVELKWFGDSQPVGFTSNHQSWCYIEPQELPKSDAVLANLFDMRIPLTFSLEDCAHIVKIITYCHASHCLCGGA